MKFFVLLGNLRDSHFIKSASCLLAVARHEGNSGTVVQQIHGVFHLTLTQVQAFGDKGNYLLH